MSLLPRFLLLAALALPVLANAADATMSRNEIEQCLRDREDVVARNKDLTAQKVAIDERGDALIRNENRLNAAKDSLQPDLAQLQRNEDELKRRGNDMAAYLQQASVVKKLQTAYKERVDRYNDDVRAHQVLLDKYNADVQVLNADQDQLDAKARATDARCVKNPVKRSDVNAAKTAVEEKPRTTVLTPETRVLP
jgi:DNA repair exonuclease SbcCD ATPase subunit